MHHQADHVALVQVQHAQFNQRLVDRRIEVFVVDHGVHMAVDVDVAQAGGNRQQARILASGVRRRAWRLRVGLRRGMGVHAASCARFKMRATCARPSGGSIMRPRLAISSKCAAMLSGVRSPSGK
ncbi:hypothetical protein G6F24_017423 [Rhizopus arrhizus]|nr:hypothetical protein G6F24_017423 [Rhizopus arrhizus]